jgi:hypothetical protein
MVVAILVGHRQDARMGLLTDYFVAPTDEVAASVLDRVGGPSSQQVATERPGPERRGIFGRKQSAPVVEVVADPRLVAFDVVDLGGIDPVVQMGTLEEILTGRDYEEIVAEDRVIANADGGERLVVRISSELTTALSQAPDASLVEAAARWSETEEFWGAADPADLTEQLGALAGIARTAVRPGGHIYCWLSV